MQNIRRSRLKFINYSTKYGYSSQSTFGIEKKPKVTIDTIRKLKLDNTPITMMTAHDYPSGFLANESNMDIILVGDSLAMVALGYHSTLEITLDVFALIGNDASFKSSR